MTLEQFLAESDMSQTELAKLLEVSPVTVHRYLKKGAIPDRVVMPKLVTVTGGKVTPNDFYPPANKSPEKAL